MEQLLARPATKHHKVQGGRFFLSPPPLLYLDQQQQLSFVNGRRGGGGLLARHGMGECVGTFSRTSSNLVLVTCIGKPLGSEEKGGEKRSRVGGGTTEKKGGRNYFAPKSAINV